MPNSADLPTRSPPHARQHRHQPYPSPQPRSSQQAHPSLSNIHQVYGGSAAPSPLTQNPRLYSPPTPDYQPGLPTSPQQYQPIQQPCPPPLPRINTNVPLRAAATTNFPPPANFTFRCPNPAYPQFTLSSRELSQTIPEFIAELLSQDRANGITPGAGSQRHGTRRTGGPVEQEHFQNKGDSPKVEKPRSGSGPESRPGQGHDQRKGGVKVVGGKSERKGGRNSVSSGGGKDIPGTGVRKVFPPPTARPPSVKPKKEPIVIKDGGDDKEPRGTLEPAEIEGDGFNEPIDSPFKDIKESPNETLVPESPTSSQTKNGWPRKQIYWNPYLTSTTAPNSNLIENNNPKPPRPWLPPIKEVAEIVADVEVTPEQWAKKLKPVAELSARTPWPLPFHEQPATNPTWHAGCPDGYEPTPFVGFPLRRPYPLWLPAAHDPNQELNRYGHWCIHEEDHWNWCVMGKCAGCLVCRPEGS
ncbi:hypothetical protein D6D01_06740 [Aureobasidium pullulans]|uniref:Uncharacterized protein n=1 Tax=Aureobasidium pullulans TaxID=5580 RepID=A0A4S9KX99_AURPU|nr:hypothetical protein D6D01_06740 [Aureobasidium pullulans]